MSTDTKPIRQATLTSVTETGTVPILDQIHTASGGIRWADLGDEVIPDAFLPLFADLMAQREWEPGTLVWVQSAAVVGGGAGGAVDRVFRGQVSRSFGFLGYHVSLLEPGAAEVRPASLYEGRAHIGATPSEASVDWTAEHQLTEAQEAHLAVSAARRAMERDRAEAEAGLARYHDTIRAALEAGVSVADLVKSTQLSRARIYQIRDGRR